MEFRVFRSRNPERQSRSKSAEKMQPGETAPQAAKPLLGGAETRWFGRLEKARPAKSVEQAYTPRPGRAEETRPTERTEATEAAEHPETIGPSEPVEQADTPRSGRAEETRPTEPVELTRSADERETTEPNVSAVQAKTSEAARSEKIGANESADKAKIARLVRSSLVEMKPEVRESFEHWTRLLEESEAPGHGAEANREALAKTVEHGAEANREALAKTVEHGAEANREALAKTVEHGAEANREALAKTVEHGAEANREAWAKTVEQGAEANREAWAKTVEQGAEANREAWAKTVEQGAEANREAWAKTVEQGAEASREIWTLAAKDLARRMTAQHPGLRDELRDGLRTWLKDSNTPPERTRVAARPEGRSLVDWFVDGVKDLVKEVLVELGKESLIAFLGVHAVVPPTGLVSAIFAVCEMLDIAEGA